MNTFDTGGVSRPACIGGLLELLNHRDSADRVERSGRLEAIVVEALICACHEKGSSRLQRRISSNSGGFASRCTQVLASCVNFGVSRAVPCEAPTEEWADSLLLADFQPFREYKRFKPNETFCIASVKRRQQVSAILDCCETPHPNLLSDRNRGNHAPFHTPEVWQPQSQDAILELDTRKLPARNRLIIRSFG